MPKPFGLHDMVRVHGIGAESGGSQRTAHGKRYIEHKFMSDVSRNMRHLYAESFTGEVTKIEPCGFKYQVSKDGTPVAWFMECGLSLIKKGA